MPDRAVLLGGGMAPPPLPRPAETPSHTDGPQEASQEREEAEERCTGSRQNSTTLVGRPEQTHGLSHDRRAHGSGRSAGKQRKYGNPTVASRTPPMISRCPTIGDPVVDLHAHQHQQREDVHQLSVLQQQPSNLNPQAKPYNMRTDNEDEGTGNENAHGTIFAAVQVWKSENVLDKVKRLQDQVWSLRAHQHVRLEEEGERVRACASNPRTAGYNARSLRMTDDAGLLLGNEREHGHISTEDHLWKVIDALADSVKELADFHEHQQRKLHEVREPNHFGSLGFTRNPQTQGYDAIYWDRLGKDYKRREVATDYAMKVKVRFNVIQVIQLDQRAESFQAYFTMHLFWIDPLLQRERINIIYKALDKDGKYIRNSERNVFLVSAPGYGNRDHYEFIFPPTQDDEKGLTRICPEQASQWQWLNSDFERTGCSRLEVPAGRLLFRGQPDWDRENIFRLKWSFRNLLGEMFVPYQHQQFLYLTEHGGCVHQKFVIIGQFSESLELQRLPFDRQLLRLEFVCEEPMEQVQLSLLPGKDAEGKGAAAGTLRVSKDGRGGIAENVVQPTSRIQQGPWMTPREWDVFEPCRTYCLADSLNSKKEKGNNELSFTTLQRLDVVIHVQRDPRFYLLNVVLFMFVLTLATGICFLVDVQDVATRTSILLTLLLCTVGYKNIVSDQLPQKPYWTWLDFYILVAFLVQISCLLEVACILNFACSPIDDDDDNDNIDGIFNLEKAAFKHRSPPNFECLKIAHVVDKGFAWVVFGLWVLIHVMFMFFYGCCGRIFFPSRDALYEKDAPEYSERGVGSPDPFGLAVIEHD